MDKKMQLKMTRKVLKILKNQGVREIDLLKIEFFFYTSDFDSAADLYNALKSIHYEVLIDKSASDSGEYLITGWTNKMKMDEDTMLSWTDHMGNLAQKYNCEFDGWGTFPGQEDL